MRITGLVILFASLCFNSAASFAQATNACDLNSDGVVNVLDVQLAVNMSLGLQTCTANVEGPGICSPDIVSRVTTAALGGVCNTHYVSISWTPSTSSNIAGYNIYRGTVSGGPYTMLNTSLVSGTSYTDTAVSAGQTWYYVVTAVNTSNTPSSYSGQAVANVPTP